MGRGERVVDVNNKAVVRGLIDSQVHPITGGMLLSKCRLHEFTSPEQMVAAIRAYAHENPEKAWITGAGWDLHVFSATGPRKELLDSAVRDRPVLIEAMDGHSAWGHSKALEVAGIGSSTPD